MALGGFLAGRGTLNPWTVFFVTWIANTASGAAVYLLGRRYGRAFFDGRLGRRLLPADIRAHIEREYKRHGVWGIFLSRLLPVWRGVVMPFAGVADVPAAQALVPLAAASALYYGALVLVASRVGTNAEAVFALLERLKVGLGILAIVAAVVALRWWLQRRRT